MKKLLFDDLLKLKPKDKFYVIKSGHCHCYYYVGVHPKSVAIIIAINCNNETKAETFNKFSVDISYKDNFIVGGIYNNKEMGDFLIEQLEHEIEVIKEVYKNP